MGAHEIDGLLARARASSRDPFMLRMVREYHERGAARERAREEEAHRQAEIGRLMSAGYSRYSAELAQIPWPGEISR